MAGSSKPRAPGATTDEPHKKRGIGHIFTTKRQIFYFAFFILWCAIDAAELGLVAQQIHDHTKNTRDWPTGEYQHAMGLLLFTTIFSLIIGIFHYALPIPILMFAFLAMGVFQGTGAGIIYHTPYGHGLQCHNPIERIPVPWKNDFHWCSRVEAIEGLAWAMFGMAVIGLFFAFADKFELRSRRNSVYDDPEAGHEKIPEKH